MKFNLSRFVEIVDRVAAPILSVTPGGDKIAPLVPKIVAGIKEAQAIKGATGAEKKQHVLNTIGLGADVAHDAGLKGLDPATVTAITSKGIDTVIEAVHVVEGAKATRVGETTAATSAARTTDPAASVPGVDTKPSSSDLGGGHSTHGHGSADDPPPAPRAPGDK